MLFFVISGCASEKKTIIPSQYPSHDAVARRFAREDSILSPPPPGETTESEPQSASVSTKVLPNVVRMELIASADDVDNFSPKSGIARVSHEEEMILDGEPAGKVDTKANTDVQVEDAGSEKASIDAFPRKHPFTEIFFGE